MITRILLVLLFWPVFAFAGPNLLIHDDNTDVWSEAKNGKQISFDGPTVDFDYVISRDRREDRGPGALLVQVIRKYNPGATPMEANKTTAMTRNKFPNKSELDNEEVRRELYELYHHNQIENFVLRHKFHGAYPLNQKSNEPPARLSSFLFNNPYSDQTAQRAYLFYYEGIGDNGSHITFNVGISDDFDKIRITIVELNPPFGVGMVSQTTEILKK